MANVRQSIDTKQKQFKIMQDHMAEAVNENLNGKNLSEVNKDTDPVTNEWYRIERGDCVQLIKGVESESIGLSVFSPPFASLYTYSSHIEDMATLKIQKNF